jgi:hypothetical protein
MKETSLVFFAWHSEDEVSQGKQLKDDTQK